MKIFLILATSVALMGSLTSLKPKVPKSLKTLSKALGNDYVFIPSGSTLVDNDSLSVQSFFMSKGEVTNQQYRTFLNDLKATGQLDKWKIALIDSSHWNSDRSINTAYVDYYFCHPVYNDYPVVNISYDGATHYCEWLTEQLAKKTGNRDYVFRLPMRSEFVYAAKGTDPHRPYAWNGPYLRNSKGMFQANFLDLDSLAPAPVTYLERPPAQADITAPVISYWPSEFGLYNLNGNVSEMISEKGKAVGGDWLSSGEQARNESVKTYQSPGPTIGFRPVMTVVGK